MATESVTTTSFKLQQNGTLTIQGPLTRNTVASLWSSWQQQVLNQRVTSVDMSQVDVIDTAGVALLIELVKKSASRSLDCHGATEQLQQIAAVSGVESLLSLS